MQDSPIKKQIAKKALSYVHDGMTIGLGTGTTASAFIELLGASGLKVHCVASSKASEALAKKCGLSLLNIDDVTSLDVTFDGADQINEKLELIKGAGGALLREKILARASKKLIIMAEEKKYVRLFGNILLPCEIVPFGYRLTLLQLENRGLKASLRKDLEGKPISSDNGNFLIDIQFARFIEYPLGLEILLNSIPGIVETGIFVDFSPHVILGKEDGTLSELD
jgi:ribose 5-phosphate isomerase A